MNFATTITHYGGAVTLPLSYTNEELKEVIDRYIGAHDTFTYRSLCQYIVGEADKDNKLVKEDNHIYECPIELTKKDLNRVTRLLWDLIWGHKIFIDFSDTTHKYGYGEFAFCVNESQEEVDYSNED